MQVRTVEDLHDKHIGHRRFAKVVDELLARGHEVKDIKEYYETFKFQVDGYSLQYDKETKDTKWYVEQVERLLLDFKRIEELRRR